MAIKTSLTPAEIEVGPALDAEFVQFDNDGSDKTQQVCSRVGTHVHCT